MKSSIIWNVRPYNLVSMD